jgi:Holliday junction DNA helicase RuvA
MIVHLSGKLLQKEPSHCVVDVGGVGYGVSVSLNTFSTLPEVGEPVGIPIFTYVREDQLVLFGFATNHEREVFRRLISVSGVGPKIALAILSGLSPNDLIDAISTGNAARLSSIPGIGIKTAQRMIVELKGVLPAQAGGVGIGISSGRTSVRDDAVSALLNLGYAKSAAEAALDNAGLAEGITIEEAVRAGLKELCKA